MPSITIRDVPSEARDELAARAARSGRSLQEYLRDELIELARRPDVDVLMAGVQAPQAQHEDEPVARQDRETSRRRPTVTLPLDSSFVVAALIDSGPVGTWAAGRLRGEPLVAPHLT